MKNGPIPLDNLQLIPELRSHPGAYLQLHRFQEGKYQLRDVTLHSHPLLPALQGHFHPGKHRLYDVFVQPP